MLFADPSSDSGTDPLCKLSSLINYKQVNPTPLAQISYPQRDGAGNPLQMVDSTGTSTYDHDHRNRMVSYTPPVLTEYGSIIYE